MLANQGKGRPPGSVNTVTREVVQAIQFAFEGMGGAYKLLEWAEQNPTEYYTKIWIKLVPRELSVTMDKRELKLDLSKLNKDELLALMAIGARAGIKDADVQSVVNTPASATPPAPPPSP